jgi:hypothetical protein
MPSGSEFRRRLAERQRLDAAEAKDALIAGDRRVAAEPDGGPQLLHRRPQGCGETPHATPATATLADLARDTLAARPALVAAAWQPSVVASSPSSSSDRYWPQSKEET